MLDNGRFTNVYHAPSLSESTLERRNLEAFPAPGKFVHHFIPSNRQIYFLNDVKAIPRYSNTEWVKYHHHHP